MSLQRPAIRRFAALAAAELCALGGMKGVLLRSALFATLPMVVGCDGQILARGIVQAAGAIPVRGADLVLASPKGWTFSGSSDDAGCFMLGGVTAPGRYRYSLVANAPGFKPAVVSVRTLQDNVVVVTLASAEAKQESSATVVAPAEGAAPCTKR
jgi:ribosomal protein S6E (S10)